MGAFIFPVLAGVFITMQNSLNGLMTPFVGALGTAFVGFVAQVVLLLLIQLGKERCLPPLRRVPAAYYAGGFAAAIIVGMVGFCVSRLGSAVTSCCSVAGQIVMSAIADHFGLFGTKRHPFSLRRVPGFALILAGVLAMNLIGGAGASSASLPLLLLAVLLGMCSIVVRTINFKATQASGSAITGGIVNSLGGMIAGFVLYLALSGFRPDFAAFVQVPPLYYLAGAFGTACLMCNIMAYKHQNIFYATIFMLIGQVGSGILMDVLVFHALSGGKCVGIAMVIAGVVLDQLLTRAD